MDLSEHAQVAIATPAVAGREVTLPLSVLFRDPLNVRKKGGKSVVALAALIYSQSLLQNLVVREELVGKGKKRKPSGRYGVVAGGRRLEALQLLLSQRKIADDYPVRCLLVSEEDALSVSLAENSEREPLHGADLFDAFKAMIDMGKSIAQVADAWGLAPITVERRLKLAGVSPKLLALYREDGIELEQLIALTLTDDHATQESVWENASPYDRDAATLRRLLTAREVEAGSPLAVFVGVEAYEQAGGTVRRDLFSDDDKGYFLSDAALLERLALERLREHAEALRASEGLAWVEARLRFDWNDRRAFDGCRTIENEPSAEQQAQLDALQEQIEALEAKWEELGPDDDEEEVIKQQEQAEEQREAILAGLSAVDPRDLSIAGAIVHLDQRGQIVEVKGLVRREDRAAEDDEGEGGDDLASGGGERAPAKPAAKAEFSERLLRQLTAHRTAAIRACLADEPKTALRVLAYQLASLVFYRSDYTSYRLDKPVEIRADFANLETDAPDMAESQAHTEFEARRERLGDSLPGEQAGLMAWVLGRDETDVLDLIAFCTAATINTVRGREAPQPVADQIAQALQLDMADWWKPTQASYLAAVPKAKVIEAVSEAVSAEEASVLAGMKKEALVGAAERKLEGLRWLPKPLRQAV
jgi:ParB family transcriptional regulator, chromosome partitioning protein